MNIKVSIKQALRDRGFVTALIVSGFTLLAVLVLCAVEIRSSELQVPIRNTVFGITYTYRDQWYNEFAFVGFALLVWILHACISLRLFSVKDRRYAIAFQWLTAIILAITFCVLFAIFRVISVVE